MVHSRKPAVIAVAALYALVAILAVVSIAPAVPSPGAAPGATDDAEALFERLKGLEGVWAGSSTQGWDGRVEYRLIASGSTLMGVSEHGAHPGDTMATMYYRDADGIGLTHYCVAGNQPRLLATEIEPGGRRATFTFGGGTGLASRDEGHMDRMVVEFVGEDEFVSRWTWYEDGEERWLEEVRYRRVRRVGARGRSCSRSPSGSRSR